MVEKQSECFCESFFPPFLFSLTSNTRPALALTFSFPYHSMKKKDAECLPQDCWISVKRVKMHFVLAGTDIVFFFFFLQYDLGTYVVRPEYRDLIGGS